MATRSPRRHYARRFSLSDPSPIRRRQTSRDYAWVESASRSSVGVFCVLVFSIAGLVGVSGPPIVVVIAFVSLLDVASLVSRREPPEHGPRLFALLADRRAEALGVVLDWGPTG